MRLGRLTVSSALVLFFFTVINWSFAVPMGFPPALTLVDAFYFSTVVATTLGFGDITPTTALGRIVVSGEAITGFVLFAFLTSTMYRKFNS
jgi:Ion channel